MFNSNLRRNLNSGQRLKNRANATLVLLLHRSSQYYGSRRRPLYSERQSSQQTDRSPRRSGKAPCSSPGTSEHLTPRCDAFLPRCSTRLAACLTCAGCLLQLCWSPGASVVEEAVLQRSSSVSAAEAARASLLVVRSSSRRAVLSAGVACVLKFRGRDIFIPKQTYIFRCVSSPYSCPNKSSSVKGFCRTLGTALS